MSIRRRFDTVCRDDLNVVGMVHRTLARGMAQSGWGGVQRGLEWQAYPGAGPIRAMPSPLRIAPPGGQPQDRDGVAAHNITGFAFAKHAHCRLGSARRWTTALEARKSRGVMKQEPDAVRLPESPGLGRGEDVKGCLMSAYKIRRSAVLHSSWAGRRVRALIVFRTEDAGIRADYAVALIPCRPERRGF
jgi:hypothetical protein